MTAAAFCAAETGSIPHQADNCKQQHYTPILG